MPYLLFSKKQQNLKLSSAANSRWRLMGFTSDSRLAGQSDQLVCSGSYRGFMFMYLWFLCVFRLYFILILMASLVLWLCRL